MQRTKCQSEQEFTRIENSGDLPLLLDGEVIKVNGKRRMVYYNSGDRIIIIYQSTNEFMAPVRGEEYDHRNLKVNADGSLTGEVSNLFFNTFNLPRIREKLDERGIFN